MLLDLPRSIERSPQNEGIFFPWNNGIQGIVEGRRVLSAILEEDEVSNAHRGIHKSREKSKLNLH